MNVTKYGRRALCVTRWEYNSHCFVDLMTTLHTHPGFERVYKGRKLARKQDPTHLPFFISKNHTDSTKRQSKLHYHAFLHPRDNLDYACRIRLCEPSREALLHQWTGLSQKFRLLPRIFLPGWL
ncbi:hypothetical protein PILCRDRAFT_570806 [Piloderma croceum F 1598]|uniref:Uncharacterized protein n=1 Tax=Piloderma croceum (strain F 1598) TaxID=765440 RepID=A0A0C3FHA8_PILCF|nr:hypothetical protein PILCRDRAFT_570806 [Piloderma croceum F 1598]